MKDVRRVQGHGSCPRRDDSCEFTALEIVHASGVRFLHFPSRSGREVPHAVEHFRPPESFKVFGMIGPRFLS